MSDPIVIVTDQRSSAYKPVLIETDAYDAIRISIALGYLRERFEDNLAECPGAFKSTYEGVIEDCKRIEKAIDGVLGKKEDN